MPCPASSPSPAITFTRTSQYDHRGKVAAMQEVGGGPNYQYRKSSNLAYLPDGLGRLGEVTSQWERVTVRPEEPETHIRSTSYYQDFLDTYRVDATDTVRVGRDERVHHDRSDYLLAPGIDNWLTLRQEDPDTGEVTGRYSFAKDGLNSTLALLDDSARVAEAYEYDAWGNLLTGEPALNSFTYTGREWDPVMEQYNYRARVYDPALGRFGSEDPAGSAPNSRSYVGNAPTNLLDPLGLNATGKIWGQACSISTKSLASCQLCCAGLQSDEINDCIGMVAAGVIYSALLGGSLALTPGAPAGLGVLGVGLSASFGYGAGCYAYVNAAGNYCEKTCAVKYD